MAGDEPGTIHQNAGQAGGPQPATRLALYRRYRPATFAEVRGQEHVTEPLQQALRNGRVHHAYLFSGPRGCGKTSSARILARSLNCVQGPTPDPCGVCESCVALAPSGPGSIDVIEIDAASHGGVDDARDLRERAFYAPVSGRFKVYIIDEAHMVTREGFNALLKLVEEPPSHLKFIFATTEPEKVIATIRSRTHHYPFRLVPPAVLRELLEEILAAEHVTYEPSMLPLVVRAGAGSVRDALSVLDQLMAGSGEEGLTYDRTVALLGYSDDSLLDDMVDAFAAGDGAAAFGTVDRVVQGGHDPRRFAADLLDRLRDLIILAAVPGAGKTGLLDVPADRLERMTDQSGSFGQAELARAAEIISDGLIQMRGTTSPRLLLELMCAQVLLPGGSAAEKVLLARLERLERKLEGVPVAEPGEPGTVHRDAPGQPDGPGQRGAKQREAPRRQAAPGHGAGAERPAAGGRPAASEGPAPSAATDGRPASTARPTATGPVSAQSLRERWPDILSAVLAKRRVAWMLLNSASVQSLDQGLLTLTFPREGEVKGFSSSGCDRVLIGVLDELLGLNVRVRAVAGPADPVPQHHGPAGQPSAGSPSASPPHSGRHGRNAPPGNPGAPAPGETRAAAAPAAASRPGRGNADRRSSAAGREDQPAGRRASRAMPAERAPGQPPAAPAAPSSFAGEEWPDDEGDPVAGELTGMELIQRQLGGQVIEEIED